MKLIWTKSNAPLSILIRWVLNEPVSHFAIVFDDKIVFHSNLLGLHIDWFNTFKKHSTIVLEQEYTMSLQEEETMYQTIIDREDGKSYDFKAFFYFAWRALLNKFFKIPMPKENKWQSDTQDICIEVVKYLKGRIPANIPEDHALAIVSPYQLYIILADQLPKQQLL